LFAGVYTIHVKYADIAIKGSPFSVDVFDPNAVKIIGQVAPLGHLGKPTTIQGKTSKKWARFIECPQTSIVSITRDTN